MDIGGFEIEQEGPIEGEDIARFISALASHWPEGLVESGGGLLLGGLVKDESVWRNAISQGLDELFIDKSQASYDAWRDEGHTVEYADQMVHLLWRSNSLTIVVDNADSETAHLVRGLLGDLWPEVV